MNIARRVALAVLACLPGLAQAAAPATPSREDIAAWWARHSDEKIHFDAAPVLAHDRQRQPVHLVAVTFFGRGRNDMSAALLVRAGQQEVRELQESVTSGLSVHDLDGDGVSEIAGWSGGSGQGTEVEIHQVLQIDGWQAVTLHRFTAKTNLGACGYLTTTRACKETKLAWTFVPAAGGRPGELLQAVTTRQGPDTDRLKTRRQQTRYTFVQQRFVKAQR